jgi:energy-coupling factor transport system ATP-binding protein
MHPRVLLLDEPLAGLDPEGRHEVLSALETLHQEGSTLLVTTLRAQTAQLAPEAVLLENAVLTPRFPTHQVIADQVRLVQAGICYPPQHWPNLAQSNVNREAPVVEIHNLHFNYPDGHSVFRGLDLTILQGQFVALVGANGAGKSTLARHLNGLLRPTKGSVRVMDMEISGHSVGEMARYVGYLFQRPERQLFSATVREEIAYGPRHLHLPDIDQRVSRTLARFGLEAQAEFPPAILSYGMQRVVTLAVLSALDTPILVLDEPGVGLDGRGWAQFLSWLAERRAAGVTLIIITHELDLAAQADRVIVLSAGQVIADGSPETVLPQLSPKVAA